MAWRWRLAAALDWGSGLGRNRFLGGNWLGRAGKHEPAAAPITIDGFARVGIFEPQNAAAMRAGLLDHDSHSLRNSRGRASLPGMSSRLAGADIRR